MTKIQVVIKIYVKKIYSQFKFYSLSVLRATELSDILEFIKLKGKFIICNKELSDRTIFQIGL